jgi:soluble lytic murein transglycosylase
MLIPFLLVIGALVKLDSKGPALFRQNRTGLNGETFVIYKFRTMTVMEDGASALQATVGDVRVSAIGRILRKFSIDELPQLYNVLLGDTAYPTLDSTPDTLEAALTHAIIRQESEFDKHAKSPACALGYMQLLPSTAREVAQKLGLNAKHIQLTHATTNIKLGSAYLSRMIHQFDGSYVLAIAAYNAGPGRVRQWVQEFGKPGRNVDQIVNWIEKIPYSETRNYVQRVLENTQVYRVILGGDKGSALKLEQDLKR